TFREGHDRLLEVIMATRNALEALRLTLLQDGVDLGDLDAEQRFNSSGDFVLGGVERDFEDNLVLLRQDRGLFRDVRGQDDVVVANGCGHDYASTLKRASMASTADLVRTSLWRRRM